MASVVSLQPQWNSVIHVQIFSAWLLCYINMAYVNKAFVLFSISYLGFGEWEEQGLDGLRKIRLNDTPFLGKCMYCHPLVG